MARHIVLGNGNLGIDLVHHLKCKSIEVHHIISKVLDIRYMKELDADVIWCCIGAGGPSTDQDICVKQILAHVSVTSALCESFGNSKTKLVFFSTHYLNEDSEAKRSHYAKTKYDLETIASKIPNKVVYRIGSLYGVHKPLKTFPGKILPKLMRGEEVQLPENMITPTSTDWLADHIIHRPIKEAGVRSIGPFGAISVYTWGTLINGSFGRGSVTRNGYDPAYPEWSAAAPKPKRAVDYSTEDCRHLWNDWGLATMRAAIKEIRAAELELACDRNHIQRLPSELV